MACTHCIVHYVLCYAMMCMAWTLWCALCAVLHCEVYGLALHQMHCMLPIESHALLVVTCVLHHAVQGIQPCLTLNPCPAAYAVALLRMLGISLLT